MYRLIASLRLELRCLDSKSKFIVLSLLPMTASLVVCLFQGYISLVC